MKELAPNQSAQLDQLAGELVLGRVFAERTPHSYAKPYISRLREVRGDLAMHDTVAFEPVRLPETARLYPDLPETLAA